MPVRNFEKAARAKGLDPKVPERPQFRGDPAMFATTHNPEPSKGSRRLKPTYQRRRRKAPKELLVGLSRREHTHPKDLKSNFAGMHYADKDHSRFVALTKAYKAK